MSLGYKTSAVAHGECGEQKKEWKNKWMEKNQVTSNGNNEEKGLFLQGRTSKPGLCKSRTER